MVKLRLASWNVVTVDKEVRRDAIFKELREHNIDIACLQETKLLNHEFSNDYHTIFSPVPAKGKGPHGGVGFACKNELLDGFVDFAIGDQERLIGTKLILNNEAIHIINVYAPTNVNDSEDKDYFYSCLKCVFTEIPPSETVFIIGDFNAQVGADNVAWPTCLGAYGVGNINDNGQRLLEFCSFHDLCVLNTYTENSEQDTHQHGAWKTWSQLDLCITRVRDRHKVITTRPVSKLPDLFDHKMVILEIDHKIEMQSTVQETEPNVEIIQIQTLFRYLLRSFVHIVIKPRSFWPAEDVKGSVRKAILTEELFSEDIFENKSMRIDFKEVVDKIESFLKNRDSILAEEDIKDITNTIIDISHLFLKEKLEIKENEFEMFSKVVDRYLTGCRNVTSCKTEDILKDTLSRTDKTDIKNIINEDINRRRLEPNDEEILQTLTIKWCEDFVLPEELLYILICKQCMNIANLPTTFENTDFCSPVWRLLGQCLLTTFESTVTADILKQRDIFKCTDEKAMLLALNLLQEKCLEYNVPLYIAFVDISQILKNGKTPMSVNEVPQWALYLPLLFSNTSGNDIQTQSEQHQLMEFHLSYILAKSFNKSKANFTLKYNFDRDLLDGSRLKAKSTKKFRLRAIQYGCNATIFATTKNEIQKCLENLENICNSFGLSFVQNKPLILAQNVEKIPRKLKFCLQTVFTSKNVTFLGVNFTSDKYSLETEIFSRIHNACKILQTDHTNQDLYINTIRPDLMRHLEILSLTPEQEKAMDKFNERCLIRFQEQSEPDGISKRISSARLALLGTYYRDRSDFITKRILYGDLVVERKPVRYLRNLKRDMKSSLINVNHWKVLAKNDKLWKNEIKTKYS